jgi:hypothetical protein
MYNRYWKENVNIFVPIIYVGGKTILQELRFHFEAKSETEN